VNAEPALSV